MILRSNRTKKVLLLVGSYFFYACWDYRFILLLGALSLFNFLAGARIYASQDRDAKRRWLVAGIVFDLLTLGVFKYFNFFASSLNNLFAPANIRLPHLEIILPVAISFITFEVISYIIDIYRGKNKPAQVLDLSLLVAFFPHLVSGPILKPGHFLPQLSREIRIEWKNLEYGVQIFLLGMVKKVVIADRLASFVDPVFQSPVAYSPGTVWLAVIAYAIQIYCDFSAYTDMAIGSARCLGFEFPPNFNMPYISRNITEFWRRWHISLSTWLKDYLYIPLGGNRKGTTKRYINIFVVMLLGGLWHGASWNFVFWGGLHGIALMVHKIYSVFFPNRQSGLLPLGVASWLVTQVFVCVAWVFFRSASFANSWTILAKMFLIAGTGGIVWHFTSLLLVLPVLAAAHIIGTHSSGAPYVRMGSTLGLFTFFFVILGLFYLAPLKTSPFIYFQF